MTAQILEAAMLICFGLSWPMNAYKSYKAATAVSTSWQFITLFTAGYLAGIAAKFFSGDINWVLIVYFLNLACLALNWAVYFRNKKLDRERVEQQKIATVNTSKATVQVVSSKAEVAASPVLGNVLIASDGSEGSLNAIRYAIKLIDPAKTKSVQVISASEDSSNAAAKRAEHAASQAHDILAEAGIDSSTSVIYGAPAEAIVKETDKQDASLVIMGSRGLGGLQGFILGSVSRSVCNNVGCPVLVVK